jgi:hypothetical protein
MKALYIHFVLLYLSIHLFGLIKYAQAANVRDLEKVTCDSAPFGVRPSKDSCDCAFARFFSFGQYSSLGQFSELGPYSPSILHEHLVIREDGCLISLRLNVPWATLRGVPILWGNLYDAAQKVFQGCFTPLGHGVALDRQQRPRAYYTGGVHTLGWEPRSGFGSRDGLVSVMVWVRSAESGLALHQHAQGTAPRQQATLRLQKGEKLEN